MIMETFGWMELSCEAIHRQEGPGRRPRLRVRVPGRVRNPLPAWDRRTWLVAIPLALIVIYAFIPVLDNGFVDVGRRSELPREPLFPWSGRSPGEVGLDYVLARRLPAAGVVALRGAICLLQLDPRGYHLTSLLLQVANAVVLYVLTVALLVRCRTDSCLESPWTCSLSAGLATALFAVHPLRVEAVAWASCQPYLPCVLFSMLAVLAYLRAFPMDSSPRWGWLVGSFLLFVAALLFKAVAVSLPAVLLILDVYPLRRFRDGTGRWFGASARRALLEKVPFVMVSLVFMGLAIAAKPQSRFPVEHYDASEGIAQACYGIWFYILKTVLPLDLIALYPLPRELNWLALPFSLSILATLAMTAGLFLLRRRWPGLLAAWLSYLVILAPNSGIIRINDQIAADRYSYMAMLGLVMLAAAGFCRLWRMSSRWRPGCHRDHRDRPRSAPGSDPHDAEPVPDLAQLGNPVDPCSDPWGQLELAGTQQLGHRPATTRGSTRRRRLITPRRCGSIPATSMPTTTWASSSTPGEVRGGGGSFHRGPTAQSRLRRCTQQPGNCSLSPGEVRGGGGSLRRGAAAQSRLRRCPQQPGRRFLPPGEVRGGGGSLHRGAAARSGPLRHAHQPGVVLSRQGKFTRRRLIMPRRCGSILTTPRH